MDVTIGALFASQGTVSYSKWSISMSHFLSFSLYPLFLLLYGLVVYSFKEFLASFKDSRKIQEIPVVSLGTCAVHCGYVL